VKLALAHFAALIVLAGGWYWASPWWTLWRMREAAQAGDLQGLATYVDYGTIRARNRANAVAAAASVRAQVRDDTPEGRAFIAFVERQAHLPDQPVAEAMEELSPWISSIPMRPLPFPAAPARSSDRPFLVRYGLDRFEMRYEDTQDETGPMLAFRRQGLGWRLVEARPGQQ
jgi:hypothetical protein